MLPVLTRIIKAINGQGGGSLRLIPTAMKRLHSIILTITYAGGTNTLAALMTVLTEIRVLVGTRVIWRLNGTQLRDFVLLNGTTRDFNGLPNSGAEIRLPFSPEWLFAAVSNRMALNPVLLGGAISVEIDSTASLTVNAWERVSDDLDEPSIGYLNFQVISPNLSGTSQYVEDPIKPVGQLLGLSVYPDSTAVATTSAGLYLGGNSLPAYEDVTSEINLDLLETAGFTPAASGRTANIFDIMLARNDAVDEAPKIQGIATKLKLNSAGYGGQAKILLARLMPNDSNFGI
jgi:hypothetical protein